MPPCCSLRYTESFPSRFSRKGEDGTFLFPFHARNAYKECLCNSLHRRFPRQQSEMNTPQQLNGCISPSPFVSDCRWNRTHRGYVPTFGESNPTTTQSSPSSNFADAHRKNQPNNPIIIIINKPTPPTQNKPSPANNHSGVRTWHKQGSAAWMESPDGAARIP